METTTNSPSRFLLLRVAIGWQTFLLALGSGILVWLALPPLGWWPLGWVAPLGWLTLIQREELAGRHPYRAIYLASVLFWMLTMQGIRLAHWANYLGLVALGLYLGVYLPIFIATARVAYHRWRVSLLLVAPVAWVGVEVARGYGPLAFSMALLGHTQVKQLTMIQVADLFGPSTVSFGVMLVAACLYRMWAGGARRREWWPAVLIVVVVGGMAAYGRYRLSQVPPLSEQPALRVALIQGSIDTVFDDDAARGQTTWEQYSELTKDACDEYQELDLVVWPETMFPVREFLTPDGGMPKLGAFLSPDLVRDNQIAFEQLLSSELYLINDPRRGGQFASRPTSWVFGASVWQLGDHEPRRYNAALLVRPDGQTEQRYFKMRPVIFGEYVPFGDAVPALYKLFPLPNGLTRGKQPVAWQVGELTLCPSICFENTMPGLLRRHVVELNRAGRPPDVLVNVTNDGWFWGSSILDMQLNCAVFRAVELRKPFLVAANTGFSAWIDANGVLQAKGPRRACAHLLAEVVPDGRHSLYVKWGDWPILSCTLLVVVAGINGFWGRRRRCS